MNTTRRLMLAGAFVVLAGVASVLAAPALPDRLVTHWNATGEPDGTMSKTLGLAFVPVLSAALLALLAVVPRVDPLGENVDAFRAAYDWFVVTFAGFTFVLHVGILAFNLGYEFDFTLLVLGSVAVLFYGVGALLTRAERTGSSASAPRGRSAARRSGSARTRSAGGCSSSPRWSRWSGSSSATTPFTFSWFPCY